MSENISRKKIPQPCSSGVARVPVIMQMESLECGAASLAMILAYYGKWTSLEQVRTDCGVSRDGAKALNIIKAARGYGMEAKGYRYETEQLRTMAKFPCIIHWNFNHFVVLNGFKGDKAFLNDPAKGSYSVSAQQLDEAFTGICLCFEPTDAFQQGGKPRSVLQFARKRLEGFGSTVAFIAITTFLASILGLCAPAFSKIFADRLLTQSNPEWLVPLVGVMIAVTAVTALLSWVQTVHMLHTRGVLSSVASASFMWHVLRLPISFFSQRMVGDITLRQSTNETIAETLINTLAPLALNTALMIVYLCAMLNYSLLLTLIGVASVFINLLVSQYVSKKRINITRVMMKNQGQLSGMTVAGVEMIETIKSSGAEDGFFEKWAGYQAGVNSKTTEYSALNHSLGTIPALITALTNAAVLIVGVWLIMQNRFTAGMLLAFQGLMSSFTAPASTLVNASQSIQEMRTNMERVEDVMNYETDKVFDETDIGGGEYEKLSGNIELKNITFGYSRLSEPLLKDFSLKIKAGSSIALVGSSGSGKSTIAKLLTGLYQPWEGEILFDGKPMSSINKGVFYSSVTTVDQDVVLFEDTISANIRMWDNSIEDFEVIMAARDASIHEDIMQRDGGYNHKLLEGGKDLSGGQRQRLEIARVLAQDPTVVILDEATSALDAKTEYEVTQAIKRRHITSVVIAHRLSTIRDCDEIIVLQNGVPVERGTHDELFALGGVYAALISSE